MTKLIGIKLNGNLHKGVEVTLSIGFEGLSNHKEVTGKLPPFAQLQTTINQWQSNYRSLGNPTRALKAVKINYAGSISHKYENCQNSERELRKQLNNWLHSESFRPIRDSWLMELQQEESARVLIRTSNRQLRQIPWHLWDLLDRYPNIELAFSATDYEKPPQVKTPTYRDKVRILAILGNSEGIDVQKDLTLLWGLPDAEVELLIGAQRRQINDQLWGKSWDIMFFAGHSQTVGDIGRIWINDRESLTTDDLKYGLKKAIKNGLSLAIFNSCDGLGLASELEALHIPQIIVMREQVPDEVAQEFLKHFLTAFTKNGNSLYQATKEARLKLHGVEDKYPCASWLPVICQNAATAPLTWLDLGRRATSINPYRGLFAFREKDAQFFFGRESFTDKLVNAVNERPFVAVIGASGSGKSSVVFAGLVKRLRDRGEWHIVNFRPGFQPLFNLATAFSQTQNHQDIRSLARDLVSFENRLTDVVNNILDNHPNRRLLLVIDQFEELYTLCGNRDERQAFLDRLLEAIYNCGNFTVVITLRTDFLEQALFYRPLADALQYADLKLGPMSCEELQAAVEKPAALLGVTMERGLVERIVSDVIAKPGNLPLLEFALNQLWKKKEKFSTQLTHAAYDDIGGIKAALADYADKVYKQLNFVEQDRAQRMFIQLVYPGEGTEDTRRVATRKEIGEENWDLVTRLADARLVVTGRDEQTGSDTVEIVHEALIGNWWRLQQWMELDRDFRRWQEDLRAAIRVWKRHGKDEKALLQGRILENAQYWQNNRFLELSAKERSFIGLSVEFRQREKRKQQRRRRVIMWGLTIGLIVALSLAGMAWWQAQNAAKREIEALNSTAAAQLTLKQDFDALITSLTAWQKFNNISPLAFVSDNKGAFQTEISGLLQEAVYKVKELNRWTTFQDEIKDVNFSPDGKIIATASADNTVKLWSLAGKEIAVLKGHESLVNNVIFSPDGQTIATASWDTTVKLWNIEGKFIKNLKQSNEAFYSVIFSPDGKTIATGDTVGNITIWTSKGEIINSFKGHDGAVYDLVFSHDGKIIASASQDKTVKLWNLDGQEIRTLNGHQDWVWSVSFNPEDNKIATASRDGTVKLWSISGEEIKNLDAHKDSVTSVVFNPDGKTFASSSTDKTVILWNENGEQLQILKGHKKWVWQVNFSPDGKKIATASKDGTVKLWQFQDKQLQVIPAHNSAIYSISYSPDGQIIATASWDKTVKVLTNKGQLIKKINDFESSVTDVSFSPDGQIIAAATNNGNVKLFNQDGELIKTLKEDDGDKAHKEWVWDVNFSHDGKTIATASMDNTVKLWTINGKYIQSFNGINQHKEGVNSVAFSPDDKTIATASWDKTIKLWTKAGKLITTIEEAHKDGVHSVTFSPDGKTIASASEDKTVKLWSQAGDYIRTIEGHNDGVFSVKFSPDGQKIATASLDNTVKLWSLDGKLLKTYKAHDDSVWSLDFNPGDRTLASGDNAGKLILWDLDLKANDLVVYGCNWVKDYLKNYGDVDNNLRSTRSFCKSVAIKK